MIDQYDPLSRVLLAIPWLLILVGCLIQLIRTKSWDSVLRIVGAGLAGLTSLAYGIRMLILGDGSLDVMVFQRWEASVGMGDTWGVLLFAVGFLAGAIRIKGKHKKVPEIRR